MTENIRILLDVDGVLADFDRGMAEYHEYDRDAFWAQPHCKAQWDTPGLLGMTWDEWWVPAMHADFWENLHKTPEADFIVDRLTRTFGIENIALLTNPSDTANAAVGKLEWVLNHYPEFRQQTFIGAAKHVFASNRHFLVDDADHNVHAFRKAGGFAVLLPQPWNTAWRKADQKRDVIERFCRWGDVYLDRRLYDATEEIEMIGVES